MHSQDVHPKHPPGKEYRDDGPRDVNYPVASRFRFPKIEHAEMVAGPTTGGETYRHWTATISFGPPFLLLLLPRARPSTPFGGLRS